jgi:pilus assembly protein CpaE
MPVDPVRVVVVDPVDESRAAFERLLQGLDGIWLAEVCKTYATAARAVADQSPDLAILNLDADQPAALALLWEIQRATARTVVLPASGDRSGDLILRTMRAGAREFLTLPVDTQELIAAIERLVHSPTAGTATRLSGRVLTLTGASGGVGCTTLAVSLAATLARDPQRTVALADFDLLLGSVDACLDLVSNYTLVELAQCADRLDLTLLKRSLTRHGSGVYVLPRPTTLEDAARIDPDAIRRVIGLLKAAFSIVIIDASKALHPSDMIAFELADTILMVARLELTCLRNTVRLMQAFRNLHPISEKTRLVINQEGSCDSQIKPAKATEFLKMPIAWTIPEARECSQARARGVPLGAVAPKCAAQKAIERMANNLLELPTVSTLNESAPPLHRLAAMF